MIRLTVHLLKKLMAAILPIVIVFVAVFALWFWLVSLPAGSGLVSLLSHVLLLGVFCCGAALLFYLLLQLWLMLQNSIYGSQAYLIRTLPLGRRQIYGACLINALVSLVLLVGLFALMILIAGTKADLLETLNFVLDGQTPQMIAVLILEVVFQWLFYVCSGYVGICFGHRKGSSGRVEMTGIGIACVMVGQALGIGLVFALNPQLASEIDSSPALSSTFITLVAQIAVIYGLFDLACILLCGWRIRKAADVE